MPLIIQWVRPGTEIWSDMWGAYNGIAGQGFQHDVVNHQYNFVDSNTAVTTTKPQNVTEGSEKEICMGCNKYVETGVQCGSCYRRYHYKCEGTTEKEIKKLYPEETHYICKKDQNSELTIK